MRQYDTRTGWGVVLISLGLVFLLAQFTGFELGRYGWPLIVVAVGGALLLIGLAGVDPSRAAVYPGLIVLTVGLLLLYQNTFDHWESWAYAWALIPAAVGLARALHTSVTDGATSEIRGGLSMAGTFAVIFFIGFAFFEGFLNISGRGFGDLGRYAVPASLILIGALMLLGRLDRLGLSGRSTKRG